MEDPFIEINKDLVEIYGKTKRVFPSAPFFAHISQNEYDSIEWDEGVLSRRDLHYAARVAQDAGVAPKAPSGYRIIGVYNQVFILVPEVDGITK
jgi:hypothetical protein